jgi:hypothetical protein
MVMTASLRLLVVEGNMGTVWRFVYGGARMNSPFDKLRVRGRAG